MPLQQRIRESAASAIKALYGIPADPSDILVNETKPEFTGDYTVVLFALVKALRKAPEAIGNELGEHLLAGEGMYTSFNVIKGFLNLSLKDAVLAEALQAGTGVEKEAPRKIIVEYSSPNTNKPLHLGHLRNNFLGWSVARILQEAGHEVRKTCIVNDRGIHICKSMIAWERFSGGATPESTGTKGDHFVGDYYVRFNEALKEEVATLTGGGTPKEEAERTAPIMKESQQMLLDWEAGKPEVIDLWKRMNSWVYAGFDATYRRIGSDFDKVYYESETYLLGKKFVEAGLNSGVLYRREDGSVWIDLREEGLDEKLLLRKDGTSVYMTQDLGLAQDKYEDFPYDQSIYVIADEQNYHMKVLQVVLKKLGLPYADAVEHLSYGMVELPSGRMKSREGTVVDADDLIDEMVREAETKVREHSRIDDFTEEELKELYETIGLGALKFFLLRVDPKKKMIFNPEESIEFIGFTGPYVQYTHARIRSILRKAGAFQFSGAAPESLHALERGLLLQLEQYGGTVLSAAAAQDPSLIAQYVFNLCKAYNSFNAELSVIRAENEALRFFRLRLCERVAEVIREGMALLGIRVPERM